MKKSKWKFKNTFQMTENRNITFQNIWNTAKAVLRGKFIGLQAYIKKQEKSQIT